VGADIASVLQYSLCGTRVTGSNALGGAV
jgi:hypothetical protein